MTETAEFVPTNADIEVAFAQVGEFMFHWAYLEHGLNSAVQKLLRLGSMEGAIATANIQVRDKINIVKTAVNHRAAHTMPTWTADSVKVINRVSTLSEDRNLVAHNFFAPVEARGLHFYKVRAKSGLDFSGVIWSAEDLKRRVREMVSLAHKLSKIVEELEPVRPDTFNGFLQGLGGSQSNALAGLRGPQTPPLGSPLGSPPATPERLPRKARTPTQGD